MQQLKPGDRILLKYKQKDECRGQMQTRLKRYTVVRLYPTYVLMVSEKGVRECFMYGDIEEMRAK